LLQVAFVDIGSASLDILLSAAALWSEPKGRKSADVLIVAATTIAKRLAGSPKDRSAADLLHAVYHPSFDSLRHKYKRGNGADLTSLADPSTLIYERAVNVCAALGVEWNKELPKTSRHNLHELMRVYRQLGVPDALVNTTAEASTVLRLPSIPLVPLVYLARRGCRSWISRMRQRQVPLVHRIPVYVLDGTTRIGRMAVRRFVVENSSVRRCLEEHVASFSRIAAAYLAAYHVDAVVLVKRSVWEQSDKITALGIESDFARAGVPFSSINPLVQTFRDHIAQFDAIRRELVADNIRDARIFDRTNPPIFP